MINHMECEVFSIHIIAMILLFPLWMIDYQIHTELYEHRIRED